MKKRTYTTILILLLWSTVAAFSQSTATEIKKIERQIYDSLGKYPELFVGYTDFLGSKVQLTEVDFMESRKTIRLNFSRRLYELKIREDLVRDWKKALSAKMPEKYSDYKIEIYARSAPIEDFIPNIFREDYPKDSRRKGRPSTLIPLTRNTSKEIYNDGLNYRTIALWPSHGYYYETRDEEPSWKFQRPAMFRTIEDLNTYEYVYHYLTPMLENAGAVVVSPRERSPQTAEVVVDNDTQKIGCSVKTIKGVWHTVSGGFKSAGKLLNENPHTMGTYLVGYDDAEAIFTATLPHSGLYGVTISYKTLAKSSQKVEAVVRHSGGETVVNINQTIGGSSWVYLGEWQFDKSAQVVLRGTSSGAITADAIRFGGGMGSVVRGGDVSGKARWAEAARYYMQYSGVSPDIYRVGEKEAKERGRKRNAPVEQDYVDDYKARGSWVKYIREEKGIPVDMSIGVHTDAGIADSIYGTLAIHYTDSGRGKLWDGSSKYASRDLCDIVVSQIVENMKARCTEDWSWRSLYDREYGEVSRPTVPSMILEMFSHQNSVDMQFGTSPRFRFEMARAIYVGILKFLADRYNVDYVVQPLPVKSFDMSIANESIRLSWEDNVDSLESTAKATHYILYGRVGEHGGWDNGVKVTGKYIYLPIHRDGVMRSYRIAAANSGGESFTSEVLSCGFNEDAEIQEVKNKCKRLSARNPYLWDYSYSGEVWDKNKLSEFVDNDNPGYGGSYRDFAGIGRAGETLDNTTEKGAEILRNGGSYISISSGLNHWQPSDN